MHINPSTSLQSLWRILLLLSQDALYALDFPIIPAWSDGLVSPGSDSNISLQDQYTTVYCWGVEVVLLGMLRVETYGYSWCTHLMYCCVTVSNSLISQLRLIHSTKPKRGRGLGKFGIPSWLYPRVLLDSYRNHYMISHSPENYGFRHTASISHQYSGSFNIHQPDIPCTPAQTSPRLSDTPQSEVRQMGSLIPLELGRLIISPVFLILLSESG